jgi:hypothetical protein
MELDEAEEHAMVGDRDRWLSITFDSSDEIVDTRRAVEHRVLGVDMEMDETPSPSPAARTGGHDAADLRTGGRTNLAAALDSIPEDDT